MLEYLFSIASFLALLKMVINVLSISGHTVAACAKSQPKTSQKLNQNIKRSIYTLTEASLRLRTKIISQRKTTLGISKIQGGSKGQLVPWPGVSFVFHVKKKSPKHPNGNRWTTGTIQFSFCALKPEEVTLMKLVKIQTEDSIV